MIWKIPLNKVENMNADCEEYFAGESRMQSELEEMSKILNSREKMIERLSMDRRLAHDEIVSLRAEVECAKEIGQCSVLSTREEFGGKLDSLEKQRANP